MKYKWYDLSHVYEEGMVEGYGHLPLKTEHVTNVTGSRITNITINSHSGTHIDAPYHLINDGITIDLIPPEFFTGLATILDIPKNELEPITYEDIKNNSMILEKADFAFIRTGWENQWGKDSYIWKYPYILPDAASLLTRFKIRIVGVDTMSPDPSIKSGLRKGFPAHDILLKNNILIIENLTGLKPLIGKIVEAFCFPLKIKNGDGSPVRVVARELIDEK
ncbi:MAG: cyclase family protein [Caldisphaera sp.]|nr:MAG: hydrolase [Caldisphaera sp.]